jgi:hypothetical protein
MLPLLLNVNLAVIRAYVLGPKVPQETPPVWTSALTVGVT